VETDRVIELGAAHFVDGRHIRRLRSRINPGCPVPPEATAVHGIRDQDLAGCPTFGEIAPRFLRHLPAAPGAPPHLAGYNARGFDVPILNAELARAGLSARIDPAQVLDVLVFVRWHHRAIWQRKLAGICQEYDILIDGEHSAAADAQATGDLLLAMVRAGRIPEEPAQALAEQAYLVQRLDAEWARWRYWLYRDRQAPQRLRLGCGKYVGWDVHDVDSGYFRACLDKIADLPEDVRGVFQQRASGAVVEAGDGR
jgi:DNA polymerase-3 subunit epsilon